MKSTQAALQALVDERWMTLALEQAAIAAGRGEVPIGAVLICGDELIATGRNQCVGSNDPTGHAEIVALRNASAALSNYRLPGCTLYVTLEPCAMCSGALLNSRVGRVVFGAKEPKTGAAGSVLNLFALGTLNHQTKVEGGVLEEQCSGLLADFFRARRRDNKSTFVPLREDALRTPERCFATVPASQFLSNYVLGLKPLHGLRLHFLDEGSKGATEVLLCLHSHNGWSFEFWELIPLWVRAGKRVLVPDLIGFGRSDKPKRVDVHTVAFHADYLIEFLDYAGVSKPTIIQLPEPDQTQSASEFKSLPFPDSGYKAALTAFCDEKLLVAEIGNRVSETLNAKC